MKSVLWNCSSGERRKHILEFLLLKLLQLQGKEDFLTKSFPKTNLEAFLMNWIEIPCSRSIKLLLLKVAEDTLMMFLRSEACNQVREHSQYPWEKPCAWFSRRLGLNLLTILQMSPLYLQPSSRSIFSSYMAFYIDTYNCHFIMNLRESDLNMHRYCPWLLQLAFSVDMQNSVLAGHTGFASCNPTL